MSGSQARPEPAAREPSKVRPLTRNELKLKDGRYLVAYSREQNA